jgi:hypothetical protein
MLTLSAILADLDTHIKKLRGTWENNRVCHECYEPKHPQLDPPSIGADAELLWRPRPDVFRSNNRTRLRYSF